MEANRKRRGFVKGKLLPFYRAVKPSSNVQYSANMVIKSTCIGQHDRYVTATAQPKQQPQKVSFWEPAASDDNINTYNNNNYSSNNNNMMSQEKKLSRFAEKLFGVAVNADESVDVKAASYISSVQERFRLERVNSERVKCKDNPAVETTS